MNRTIAIPIYLLLTTTVAEAQIHTCYVRYSDVDTRTKVRTSFSSLGEFSVSFADGTVTKSFHHDESKVTVNVGVMYPDPSVGNEEAGLILALAFSGKTEDVFDEPGSTRAQAMGRDPTKISLIVSKSIAYDSRVWNFYLSCVPKKRSHR